MMNGKKVILAITVNVLVAMLFCWVVLFIFNSHFSRYDKRKLYSLCIKAEDGTRFWKPNSRTSVADIDYTINSLGFRDREFDIKKPKGQYRILCVGDSFTFGEGVKAQEAYPKVLETMLQTKYKNVEVINTGVSGYNTVDEYLYIRNKLLSFNADLIILGFYIGNDPEDPSLPFNQEMKENNDIGKRSSLEVYFRHKKKWEEFSKMNYWEKYRAALYDPEGSQWKTCRAALESIRDLAASKGIALLVLVIPETDIEPNSNLIYHLQLAETLNELQIKFIDASLSVEKADYVYEVVGHGDYHPAAKVHAIYARLLFEMIKIKHEVV